MALDEKYIEKDKDGNRIRKKLTKASPEHPESTKFKEAKEVNNGVRRKKKTKV